MFSYTLREAADMGAAAAKGFRGIGVKLSNSIKSAAVDYKNAANDTLISIRNRPLKAAIYTGLFSTAVYLTRSKPSAEDFAAEVIENKTKMTLLSDSVRNKECDSHLKKLSRHMAKNQLRYQNLVFFSVIYSSEYDSDNKFYESQCKYLKPKWSEIFDKVLDVGCCGKWWVMRYKMTDYDIDFEQLPKDLTGTSDVIVDFFNRLSGVSHYRNPVVPIEEQRKQCNTAVTVVTE